MVYLYHYFIRCCFFGGMLIAVTSASHCISGSFVLLYGQSTTPNAVNLSSKKINQRHLIDKKEFEQMPTAKQQHILANMDKYELIDAAALKNTQVQATINSTQALNLNTTSPNIITEEELKTVEPTKQSYIMAHPELYSIVQQIAISPTNPNPQSQYQVEQQQNKSISVPTQKYKVTKEEIQAMPPDKLEYIKSRADIYEMPN